MEKKETLDAIYERIKALEGEVCALRVQNKRMRVVIAALFVFAALPYLIAAGMQTQTFSVLRVERLEFVQDGKLVAYITGGGILSEAPGLGIYDKDGNLMVVIGYNTLGPLAGSHRFTLINRNGEVAIGLWASPNGFNHVSVYNNKGIIVSSLSTASIGNPTADRNSGSLYIADETGKGKIVLFVSFERDGILGVTSRDGASGVFIGGTDTGGRIEITRSAHVGTTKKAAVTISVAPNGSGVIATSNSLGLPLWISPQR